MSGDSEIVRIEQEPLTAIQIKAQVNRIQEVMKAVMQDGVHYGKVPGCGDKPTLLKPGAEKIMATFRLAADPQIEDLSGPDVIRYRVKVNMLTPDGGFVGAGIGECSSDEEKYKWKKAACDEEYAATDEDRRRPKWKPGYGGKPAFSINQVRTNPADVANTVLKMAKKRALVDGVLTATGASDIFTQDIEDMPEEILNPSKAGASKTSTVKEGKKAVESKDEGKKAVESKDKVDERTIQLQLGDALHAYCNGDEARMKETLKDISYFEPKDGKPKWLTSLKKVPDKWAKTSLEKLKRRIKEEGAGKEASQPSSGYPEGCTEKPAECEHSVWKAGVPFCCDVNTACGFWDNESF